MYFSNLGLQPFDMVDVAPAGDLTLNPGLGNQSLKRRISLPRCSANRDRSRVPAWLLSKDRSKIYVAIVVEKGQYVVVLEWKHILVAVLHLGAIELAEA